MTEWLGQHATYVKFWTLAWFITPWYWLLVAYIGWRLFK